MKKYKIIGLLFWVSCFCWQGLLAQDLAADMLEVVNTLEDSERLSFKVKAAIYESEESLAPDILKKGSYQKEGKRLAVELDKTKTLFNERCVLMVAELEKEITYQTVDKKQKQTQKEKAAMPFTQADDLLAHFDSVHYHGTEKQGKHYTVYSNQGAIQKMDIYLSEAPLFFHKLVYYYNREFFPDQYKAIIEYQELNTQKAIPEMVFSEFNYLQEKDKQLSLLPSYKNYQLYIYENE